MKIDELDSRRAEAAQLRYQIALKEAEAATEKARELQEAFGKEWEAMCAKYGVDPKATRLDFKTFELVTS